MEIWRAKLEVVALSLPLAKAVVDLRRLVHLRFFPVLNLNYCDI